MLGEAGLTTLLVEGGGELAAALLRRNLVDEIYWLQAPMLLGGDGRPALGALELRRLDEAPRFSDVRTRAVGPDLVWQARLPRRGMAARTRARRP